MDLKNFIKKFIIIKGVFTKKFFKYISAEYDLCVCFEHNYKYKNIYIHQYYIDRVFQLNLMKLNLSFLIFFLNAHSYIHIKFMIFYLQVTPNTDFLF